MSVKLAWTLEFDLFRVLRRVARAIYGLTQTLTPTLTLLTRQIDSQAANSKPISHTQ